MGETAEGKHTLSISSLLSQGPLPPVVLIIKLPGDLHPTVGMHGLSYSVKGFYDDG